MTTAIIGTGAIGSAIACQLAGSGETLQLSSADKESAQQLAGGSRRSGGRRALQPERVAVVAGALGAVAMATTSGSGKIKHGDEIPCLDRGIASVTMTSANVATAVTFVKAAHLGDLGETSHLIGDGYAFTDHLVGLKAETLAALQEATSDFAAWSSWNLRIDNVMETIDGTVIVQFVATGTHTGPWQGIAPTGKRAVFSLCDFFRFDSQGRVISEEVYGDRFSIMEQLGVVESPACG